MKTAVETIFIGKDRRYIAASCRCAATPSSPQVLSLFRGFIRRPPVSNLWLFTDDALTDFWSLKETEVTVSLPRLQLEIERLRRPETMNVAHRDFFASEGIIDAAPRHIGAGKAVKNAQR